jgi:hypothetical protein
MQRRAAELNLNGYLHVPAYTVRWSMTAKGIRGTCEQLEGMSFKDRKDDFFDALLGRQVIRDSEYCTWTTLTISPLRVELTVVLATHGRCTTPSLQLMCKIRPTHR